MDGRAKRGKSGANDDERDGQPFANDDKAKLFYWIVDGPRTACSLSTLLDGPTDRQKGIRTVEDRIHLATLSFSVIHRPTSPFHSFIYRSTVFAPVIHSFRQPCYCRSLYMYLYIILTVEAVDEDDTIEGDEEATGHAREMDKYRPC